jgi:hypothetical protein
LKFITNSGFPIKCRLEHVYFNQDYHYATRSETQTYSLPRYQTLSYTWGSSRKTDTIIVNGYPFSVTRNLFEALCKLRTEDPGTNWWVDAICINQEDIAERNEQVSLMRAIYKESQEVLIWLGEEADDSSLAIDTINMRLVLPPSRGPGRLGKQLEPFADITDEEKNAEMESFMGFLPTALVFSCMDSTGSCSTKSE